MFPEFIFRDIISQLKRATMSTLNEMLNLTPVDINETHYFTSGKYCGEDCKTMLERDQDYVIWASASHKDYDDKEYCKLLIEADPDLPLCFGKYKGHLRSAVRQGDEGYFNWLRNVKKDYPCLCMDKSAD